MMTGGGYRLKRARGVRRVEREDNVWIARDVHGEELLEAGFRWNTRSGAWHAAYESDFFAQNETSSDK